jgi:two-component system sensor histidine kinase KdpD
VSIIFLAAVVASAALWGFGPALFASVLSVAAGAYFFYPPILSFGVAAEQDLADLAVFVVVAAFTSRLAVSVRKKALEAEREQEKMGSLLAFSERLAAAGSEAEVNAAVVEHLSPVLGGPLRLSMEEPPAAPPGRRLTLATEHGPVAFIVAPEPREGDDPDYEKALLAQAAHAIERARLRREVAEARLKVQGEALREALLNSVSHDLQTPLAAILGSATALESFDEQADPVARRELVATIREESERLAAYIENVLDLTRIRAGQIAPRLELVELSDILDAALRRKQKALAGHGIRLRLPADLPMLKLDLFLMEHAIANLLDNAAKYAPPGSEVAIEARAEADEIVLDITNAGSGIRPEELERIFEPFYRGAGPEGPLSSGTGLGLAICRAFVEANAGSVVALSAGTAGTTLRVRLPMPEPAAAPEAGDE